MDEKSWYKSKTVWATLIVLAVAGLNTLGLSTAADEVSASSTQVQEWIMSIVTIAGGIFALFGRITAKSKITK